ncbi:MAG: branched-chain amino acid ABC transporter permease [Myxococcales bacterium]|nr:branched-chain amino acid ABC transporter permease [Myxococcales bacterium]
MSVKPLRERLAFHKPNVAWASIESVLPFAAGIGVAFALQLFAPELLGAYWGKVALDVGIAIILAVSLNIVNGLAGQFSLGHAGFMLIGGYGAAYATYYGSIALWGSPAVYGGFMGGGDMLFLAACLWGGFLAALAGVAVGLPSLRLRGDYLAIVTLGFGEIMRVLVQRSESVLSVKEIAQQKENMVSLTDNLGGALGFSGLPNYTRLFYVYLFVAVLLVVAYRMKTSRHGRALLAVRENEVAAEAMGVNTTRAKVTAFVFGAFFAGIGGGLFAHELGVALNPAELGFLKSIDVVIMVVLGGMGSISGCVIAAAALTILPEVFREFADYRMIVYSLALILVMIVRPQGLFGVRELWDFRWRKRRTAQPPSAPGGDAGTDAQSQDKDVAP